MPLDYIIAGPKDELARWPKFANDAGILVCAFETLCEGCCTRMGHGCGLSDGVLAIETLPISNVKDFVDENHEAAIVVSRKPARERPGFEERRDD